MCERQSVTEQQRVEPVTCDESTHRTYLGVVCTHLHHTTAHHT